MPRYYYLFPALVPVLARLLAVPVVGAPGSCSEKESLKKILLLLMEVLNLVSVLGEDLVITHVHT
jgi:hypothetical protein